MKRLQRAIWVVVLLLLLIASRLSAQTSNYGTEFWTGYMDHINPPTLNTPTTKMSFYIAANNTATVTISIIDGSFATQTVTVIPNVITVVDIPLAAFLSAQGIYSKGIHIVSDKPIAVYQHIYRDNVSGATVLLPVNTLATDYMSINYKQLSNNTPAYSTFMVVATEDSTNVQITPIADMLGGEKAKVPYTITLQKGQVYQGLSATDLTGTKISSISTSTSGCKRIAVFSGSSKIIIGYSSRIFNGSTTSSGDNLIQQSYPTASWGKNFITAPLKSRYYDIFRIVVSDPTAVVTLNGSPVAITNGLYYEFPSVKVNTISSDKPIQVVQYSVSQAEQYNFLNSSGSNTGASDIGDPEMIYLNPIEQNIDHVTLYATAKANITASYVNVVIPTAAASTFLLDGVVQTGQFTAIAGTSYSYAQLSISTGNTHVISASQGFNAIAYGFGNVESYGYSAGTNVKNLNEYVQNVDPVTNKVLDVGCSNESILPQIILPYQTVRLIWNLGNNNKIDTVANPVVDHSFTSANGTLLYQYNYTKAINYSKAGIYDIKVTATDPITTACGSDEDIFLSYTIFDPPVAKFTARDTVCAIDTVQFADKTTGDIKTWHWDFGSGVASDTSNLQSPVHKFLQPGTFTVTLTTTGTAGCNTVYAKKIYVRKLPVANFSIPTPVCDSPLAVTFIDASVPSEGKLTSWFWDFGDGTTALLTSAASFTHKYATAQSYTVKLIVTTDKSCTASLPKTQVVNFSPKVDFLLPDACQTDNVKFTSTTTVADSTSGPDPLTYSWNFGDPTNTTSPNTASTKVAFHHFNKVGNYNIKLTVTTKNGCVADSTKVLVVNGSNPKAVFKVITPYKTRCSNRVVVFENDSYIPTFDGKVTSFNVDFGDGTPVQTFRVDSGATFSHQYSTIYTALTKPYTVTMTAFSGVSLDCRNVFTDTLSVQPVPKPVFTLPDSVCENYGKLNLALAVKPTAGTLTGTPVFYIDGLKSPNGIFNTQVLGAGIHTVMCDYFAPGTGCDTVMTLKVKIEPVASVEAGQDIYILAGAKIVLRPTVVGGNNLQYLWSPAAGLSDPTKQNVTASPPATTMYTLTVTSVTGIVSCPVTDSVKVYVLQPPEVPNTFTPNGDSHNDFWYIKELDKYPGCIVSVYTRNGERVFYSVGYSTPWDGRYNSVNLPVGTYYYVIDPKNGRDKITGSVTIIR